MRLKENVWPGGIVIEFMAFVANCRFFVRFARFSSYFVVIVAFGIGVSVFVSKIARFAVAVQAARIIAVDSIDSVIIIFFKIKPP